MLLPFRYRQLPELLLDACDAVSAHSTHPLPSHELSYSEWQREFAAHLRLAVAKEDLVLLRVCWQ